MASFLISSSVDQLAEFELLRNLILKGKNIAQVKTVFSEMLSCLKDVSQIEKLHANYWAHFHSSAVKWSIEYEIATKILEKEVSSREFTYIFELTNYVFYYHLFSMEFRSSFFLLHGLPFDLDGNNYVSSTDLNNRRYVIYKQGQELYSTYIIPMKGLNKASLKLFQDFVVVPSDGHDNRIIVLQLNEDK